MDTRENGGSGNAHRLPNKGSASPQLHTPVVDIQGSGIPNAEVTQNSRRLSNPTLEKQGKKRTLKGSPNLSNHPKMYVVKLRSGSNRTDSPVGLELGRPDKDPQTTLPTHSESEGRPLPPPPLFPTELPKAPVKSGKVVVGGMTRSRRFPPQRLPLKEAKQLQAFPTIAPSLEKVTGRMVEGAEKKAVSLAFSRGNILDRVGAPNQAKRRPQAMPQNPLSAAKLRMTREAKVTSPGFGEGGRAVGSAPDARLPPPLLASGLTAKGIPPASGKAQGVKLPQLVYLLPSLTGASETETGTPPTSDKAELASTRPADPHCGAMPNGGNGTLLGVNSALDGLDPLSQQRYNSEGGPNGIPFHTNNDKVGIGAISMQSIDDPLYHYHPKHQRNTNNSADTGSEESFSCDSDKLTPLRLRNPGDYHSSVLHLNEETLHTGHNTDEGSEMSVRTMRLKAESWGSTNNSDLRFPRFNRLLFTRNTKVYASVDSLKQTLNELKIPYIPELDHRVLTADFNTYKLAEIHGTFVYVVLAMNVLLSYELVNRFGFDVHKLLNFIKEAFTFFTTGSPLHHFVHAADIIVAVHQWLSQPTVGANLSDEEMLPFLFTSVVMRVGHCGMSNHFLTQERHPYMMICGCTAPQQGATMSLIIALLEKPENHFFPSNGVFTESLEHTLALTDESDRRLTSESFRVHTWSSEKEDTFYDMVAELIMATDERSYYNIQRSLEQIDQDHFVRHGCICPETDSATTPMAVPRATNHLPQNLNKDCKRCCAYISDSHLPTVLSAVLHILNYSYVFRPYEVFLLGNVGFSSSMYHQSDLHDRMRKPGPRLPLSAAKDEDGRGKERRGEPASPDRENDKRSGSGCSSGLRWVGAGVTEAAGSPAPAQARLTSTSPGTITPDLRWPQLTQQTTDSSSILATSAENVGDGEIASSIGDLLPRRPLQFKGRNILLHAFEEIHYPMVQTIQPYVPADWVQKSHHNFTRFLTELPTEEEYDLILERVLQLCGVSRIDEGPCENSGSSTSTKDRGVQDETKPSPLQRLIQAVEEIEVAKHIPFHIIDIAAWPKGKTGRRNPNSLSMDAKMEVRILKEILHSSLEFIAREGESES
ncbi:unnamed protein product [Phytomonas sp. Hart1]|nr:unnamed protein product [Phytomonas sp. Hart1]|eukprot:CCW70803.1 unnamed protein product [Phytomonas sp. isolate Hart1]